VQSCGHTFAHTFATTFCCQEWPVCPSSSAGAGARRHTRGDERTAETTVSPSLAVSPGEFHSLIHREYAIRIPHDIYFCSSSVSFAALVITSTPVLIWFCAHANVVGQVDAAGLIARRGAHVVNQPSVTQGTLTGPERTRLIARCGPPAPALAFSATTAAQYYLSESSHLADTFHISYICTRAATCTLSCARRAPPPSPIMAPQSAGQKNMMTLPSARASPPQ
jgi:hypothetical protein